LSTAGDVVLSVHQIDEAGGVSGFSTI